MTRVLLALLAALATTSTARAQSAPAPAPSVSPEDDAKARALFQAGKTDYEEGHYAEAIAAWKEAFRLSGRPLFHYNLGNAYERLGDLKDAIAELTAYRAVAPAAERSALDQRIASLQERLEQQEADSVFPPANEHPLVPAPAPASSPAPGPAPAPAPVPHSRRPVPATWTLGAITVAGAATGAGFGLASLAAKRQATAHCVLATDTYCWTDAGPYLKRNARDAAIADAGFGLAGGAAIAGVVVTLLHARSPVRPVLLRDGGGLSLGVAW